MQRGDGLVVVNYGARVLVDTGDGHMLRCAVRGRRLRPVCGDRVEWEMADADSGVIGAIGPRERTLQRADGRGGASAIASWLDRVVVVVAPEPAPEPVLVDRYLVMVEAGGIDAAILLNKSDRHPPGFRAAFDDYARAGYPLWSASATTEAGLEALQSACAGRVTLLVGQSGVGKSSLLNTMIPDLELQTGLLSVASGEGRHTTTATTRYRLPDGGALVDSPGVREFWLPEMPATTLAGGFREIAARADGCRFRNCVHAEEPGCAVIAAVADGGVSRRRYDSYRQLLRTIAS